MVACITGTEMQAKLEPDLLPATQASGAVALPTLFRPGQQAQAVRAGGAQHAPTSLQSVNYQANINAFAQQEREQRLKLKQAAVKAEVELDRLKTQLQREQTLQVSNASLACNIDNYAIIVAYPTHILILLQQ